MRRPLASLSATTTVASSSTVTREHAVLDRSRVAAHGSAGAAPRDRAPIGRATTPYAGTVSDPRGDAAHRRRDRCPDSGAAIRCARCACPDRAPGRGRARRPSAFVDGCRARCGSGSAPSPGRPARRRRTPRPRRSRRRPRARGAGLRTTTTGCHASRDVARARPRSWPIELGDRIVADAGRLIRRGSNPQLHRARDFVDRAAAERVVRMRLEQRPPRRIDERAAATGLARDASAAHGSASREAASARRARSGASRARASRTCPAASTCSRTSRAARRATTRKRLRARARDERASRTRGASLRCTIVGRRSRRERARRPRVAELSRVMVGAVAEAARRRSSSAARARSRIRCPARSALGRHRRGRCEPNS